MKRERGRGGGSKVTHEGSKGEQGAEPAPTDPPKPRREKGLADCPRPRGVPVATVSLRARHLQVRRLQPQRPKQRPQPRTRAGPNVNGSCSTPREGLRLGPALEAPGPPAAAGTTWLPQAGRARARLRPRRQRAGRDHSRRRGGGGAGRGFPPPTAQHDSTRLAQRPPTRPGETTAGARGGFTPAITVGLAPFPAHLDALVAGAGRHAPPVEVERDVVDEVAVIRRDAPRHKHPRRLVPRSPTFGTARPALPCPPAAVKGRCAPAKPPLPRPHSAPSGGRSAPLGLRAPGSTTCVCFRVA